MDDHCHIDTGLALDYRFQLFIPCELQAAHSDMENLHAIDPKSTHEVSGHEVYSNQGPQDGLWLRFLTYTNWYPKDMSHPEKKLILKLDVMILVFGCLSFFTKYLDQQAITNAYVSYVGNTLSLADNPSYSQPITEA
jgi:hypothetical protein